MIQEHSERIFDSLMEEMLTEQHPPDLTARIVAAWRSETSAPPSSKLAPSRDAVSDLAASDVPSAKSTAQRIAVEVVAPLAQPLRTAPAPVTIPSPSAPTIVRAAPTSNDRSKVAWALATIAAGLLIFLGWKANQTDAGKAAPFVSVDVPDASQPDENKSLQTAAANKPAGARETIPLDDLPFSNSDLATARLPSSEQNISSPGEKLGSAEVIASLDGRLKAMWNNMGVTPSPAYDPVSLAQKMSVVLTGQELSQTVLLASKDLDKAAIAATAIDSRAFAKLWAEKFIAQWLGNSAGDADALAEMKQLVAAKIENGEPWSGVPLDLLGGNFDNAKSSNSVFVAALAGGENHRLVERLGTMFLDANLACVRCHDAGGKPTRATEQQETYWSLVAMLKGIDARKLSDQTERVVLDRQSELFSIAGEIGAKNPKVFYDLPNGALKSAEAKLPDGSVWSAVASSPRQALAQWLSQSPEADRATVNLVWKMVFGRPLVPHVVQTDSVGISDRVEMLEFLAGQFRASDHDVRQLIGWIVKSEAFTRQPVVLDKSQWLDASDEDLQSYQLRELVFAASPSLGRSAEARSLESSLAAVVLWQSPSDDGSELLAQPSTEPTTRRPRLPSSVKMPAMSFVLHGQHPTISQRNFVTSLLRADRLSWEQRVEHVVGLNGHYSANGRVQQLAKELLEQNSGDASSALLQLLWAVQNSDAG